MLISEIYNCLQGEGPLRGTPSVLIRTSICNLRCSFKDGSFCDTPYTSWDPEQHTNMSPSQILKKTRELAGNLIRYVIISGGEPTCWSEELLELSDDLQSEFHVTLETNGTKFLEFDPGSLLVSVSPKLNSSVPFGTAHEKMHQANRLNISALTSYISDYDSYLKFVVTSLEDLEEIKMIQKETKCPNDRIYLMPEGMDPQSINDKKRWIANLCLEHGYKFTSREHVDIFGNKRGV